MKYYINYHTGAGDFEIEGTLEEAMAAADDGAAYTQLNITIEDEDDNVIAQRNWRGVAYDPEESEETEEDIISYGDCGYYGAWVEL